MKIPDNTKDILKDIHKSNKNAVIYLSNKYDNQKVLVTIYDQFSKFKNDVRKSLKEKDVEDEDIRKVLSFIQNNYREFYPDDGHFEQQINSEDIPNKSERPIITIEQWRLTYNDKYLALRCACDKNFPGLWHSMDFMLSIHRILSIKGCTLPFAGIILGPPSSSKTLAIELLRNSKNVYYTDSFSSKAFVSHNTAVPKDQLEDIDLLPRIKGKCLLAPELSPIFSKKDEDLIEILGILTRILDGHGYQSDSGAHGRRGYSGEHMFTMIGAAVDIPYKVHRQLATLGPKLYFYRMPKSNKTDSDYIQNLQNNDFSLKVSEVQDKLNDCLNWFEQCYPISKVDILENNGLIKVQFGGTNDDDFIVDKIVKFGKLLARLRGTVSTWNTDKTQGSNYAYSTPTIEEPERAMTQLLNLAKGHALSQGRNYLTQEDLTLLVKVVLSTASLERVIIFDLLLASKGALTASQVSLSLRVSKPTALRTMAELVALGVVSGDLLVESDGEENENHSNYGKPTNAQKTIRIAKEFEWFLSDEFHAIRNGYCPEGESKYDHKSKVHDHITQEGGENKSVKKISPLEDEEQLPNEIDKDYNASSHEEASIIVGGLT